MASPVSSVESGNTVDLSKWYADCSRKAKEIKGHDAKTGNEYTRSPARGRNRWSNYHLARRKRSFASACFTRSCPRAASLKACYLSAVNRTTGSNAMRFTPTQLSLTPPSQSISSAGLRTDKRQHLGVWQFLRA